MTAGWSDEHKRDELVAVFRRVERSRLEESRRVETLAFSYESANMISY